jgi:G3E family GTPase
VITLVDCKHFPIYANYGNLHDSTLDNNINTNNSSHDSVIKVSEAIQQISFADVIILNKIDLISNTSDLRNLQHSIQIINSNAKLITCSYANLSLEDILNIKAFDLDRNMKLLVQYDDSVTDTSCTTAGRSEVVNSFASSAAIAFNPIQILRDSNGQIQRRIIRSGVPSKRSYKLPNINHSDVEGDDIRPVETDKATDTDTGHRTLNSNTITTLSLVYHNDLDLHKFNLWISELLRDHGQDVFRVKGKEG